MFRLRCDAHVWTQTSETVGAWVLLPHACCPLLSEHMKSLKLKSCLHLLCLTLGMVGRGVETPMMALSVLDARVTQLMVQGPIVMLGNFSYVGEPLKLGDLSGNRFGIVLRNVSLPSSKTSEGDAKDAKDAHDAAADGAGRGAGEGASDEGEENAENEKGEGGDTTAATPGKTLMRNYTKTTEEEQRLREVIDERCQVVKEKGFINYFGLQRFGSGGGPTSDVGIAMLKGDWQGAVRLIMAPRFGESEAVHKGKVGHAFRNKAL